MINNPIKKIISMFQDLEYFYRYCIRNNIDPMNVPAYFSFIKWEMIYEDYDEILSIFDFKTK